MDNILDSQDNTFREVLDEFAQGAPTSVHKVLPTYLGK
jgi:hypothetical protein